jgi:DNA-binding response OmpR family regulator
METIIVQDTDQTVLEMLTTALEMENFEVYPLMDFDEDFIGLIERTRPHVVILDYRLTGRRCLEVLRSIKLNYPNLPVIATSCNNNIHQEYNKLGFDGYIEKPFDLALLYRVLRKYIPSPQGNPV